MILDRDLYLTADRDEVVEEGDPRAAFLLGNAGSEVSDDEAERLGLNKPKAEPKEAAPAANKQRKTRSTKAKG